jgi:acyl-CoA reductase-like NAD-dependent aldehyde dehydrogenase
LNAPRLAASPLHAVKGKSATCSRSYGGYKESGIGREFSLEGRLDCFTQRKNVTVNLNTPRRA